MLKKYNFLIEGKIIDVYESSYDSAEKLAYEIIADLKRIPQDD